MMKSLKIKILLISLLAFLSCDTKNDFEGDYRNYFVKYYGEDGNQEAADLLLTDDGVLMLGTTRMANQSRIVLIKVNYDGDEIWRRTLGAYSENAKDIEPTTDGQSYLILSNVLTGKNLVTNEDLYDAKVIKVNRDGIKEDSAVYSEHVTQFMNSVTPLSDGGFFLAGNSADETIFNETLTTPPPDQEDIIYVQFTPAFDPLTSNESTAAEHYGAAVKMFETSSGIRIFVYSDNEFGLPIAANANHAVYETYFSGGSWSTGYPYSGTNDRDEILKHVIKDPFTNGYFELGTSCDMPTPYGNLYFARRTGGFAIINQGVVNGLVGNYTAAGVAPCLHTDDGYLVVANQIQLAGTNIKLVKLDQNCTYQWDVSFGSASKQNVGVGVAELPDGRIVVLGTIELETQKKIALMKINPQGKFSD
ncbi:hypothetical protein [Pseudochryseolinea flava]|uniref:Uncharacterized protein n=1 Tax=Pseudochryseolinea flava TaxID=2059302 RepID=A0A364XUZ2_9BACT|nr:hypothetical protein [Pseudochryseolinea flava]RAV97988.1 hypothetical protein DQQ10_25635 [Pseudochryseolinea flava]